MSPGLPPVSTRAALILAGAGLALATACSFPDQGPSVHVSITAGAGSAAPVVVRGAALALHARAWHVTGSDSTEIRDAQFDWTVTDPRIATVNPGVGGAAQLVGVNPGIADIRARVTAYQGAQDGAAFVRVANPLEIDSIRPDTLRYGRRARVYGVGINSIFLATLGAGTLIPDTFSIAGSRNGLGSMEFWVPPPAGTGEMLAFGPGVFATSPETTRVRPFDIYEPNDTAPAVIDLDNPGPIAQLPQLVFYNPALFYEPAPRGGANADWYEFTRTDTTGPLSILMTTPGQSNDSVASFLYLSDSIYYSGGFFVGPRAWMIGTSDGLYFCHGLPVFAATLPSDSVIWSFTQWPSRQLDLLAFFNQAGPQRITMIRGYVRLDPSVPPDHFEENDYCDAADANFATQPIVVTPASPWLDSTLTIDNPHDPDWYRFRVDSLNAADTVETLTVKLVGLASAATDTSDVDIQVLDTAMNVLASSENAGSAESLTVVVHPPVDLYLLATDFAGAPTRYAVCMTEQADCALPAPPPAPAAVLERLRAAHVRAAARAPAVMRAAGAAGLLRGRTPLPRP